MKILASWVTAIGLMALGGCVENAPAAKGGRCHAECLVCKHNNDLACVDVEVDAATPHLSVGGKEYFFCSESCRTDFQKNPGKFQHDR